MNDYVNLNDVFDSLDTAIKYFNKVKEDGVHDADSCESLVNGLGAAYDMLSKKADAEYVYPENLFRAVFLQRIDRPITDDQKKGLEYVLNDLTSTEREVISLRYADGKTFKEVGEIFNVSRSRIMQIADKALRKLRNPVRSRYLVNGYSIASGEVRAQVEELRQQEIDKVNEEIDRVLKVKREYLEGLEHSDEPKAAITAMEVAARAITIDDLDLSVRSYNCLRRIGIQTAADILWAGPSALCKIRNLGRRSFTEICERLIDRGFIVWADGTSIRDSLKEYGLFRR